MRAYKKKKWAEVFARAENNTNGKRPLVVLSANSEHQTQSFADPAQSWKSQLLVVCLQPATVLQNRLLDMFSCEFCEIFETTFLKNSSGELLLEIFTKNTRNIVRLKEKVSAFVSHLIEMHCRLRIVRRIFAIFV